MPRYKDEPTAVRVYTVCDESRYLIVRNVPALGCGDELLRLFATYGDIEECKPMDTEQCESYTDVYWIKFLSVTNARFAKRKLDEHVFLGNRLNVKYAPDFETMTDTKEKLECRRKEVMARSNSRRDKSGSSSQANFPRGVNNGQRELSYHLHHAPVARVSTEKEYFPSRSMNQTVKSVREKLNKIQSGDSASNKAHAGKRRRV